MSCFYPTHETFQRIPAQNLPPRPLRPGPATLTDAQREASADNRARRRAEEVNRQRTYRRQQALGLPLRFPLSAREQANLDAQWDLNAGAFRTEGDV